MVPALRTESSNIGIGAYFTTVPSQEGYNYLTFGRIRGHMVSESKAWPSRRIWLEEPYFHSQAVSVKSRGWVGAKPVRQFLVAQELSVKAAK